MIASENRLAIALVGAFLLWIPTFDAMITDNLEPSTAGLRYGAAVGFVWVATRVLERVVQGYAIPPDEQPPVADAAPATEAIPSTGPADDRDDPAPPRRRRRDDAVTAVAPGVDVAHR